MTGHYLILERSLAVIERAKRYHLCAVIVFAAALSVGTALAEQPEFRNSGPTNASAQSLPATLPNGSYQNPPTPGVSYSRIFRNTGAPYTDPLNPIAVTPSIRTSSVQANATVGLPLVASFPLIERGFEPQDADLKLGPVFFKLQGVSAAVLWSDNINLTETNRESGTIGIVTISGAIIAQLTEGLRAAISGSLVYLPFKNEIGIAGFGIYAPFLFGFDNQPIARSEITWNTMIAGWNVVFADDFQIGIGRYSNNIRDDAVLFSGGGFNGYDQAGRYVFRAPQDPVSDRSSNNNHNENNNDFVYFSNTVSAQVDRLVVGKTRLRVQLAHQNLWYNQGGRGLPTLRDEANVSLVSERENLRFKPFIIYQALKTDLQDSFVQSVRIGVDGPITDQLQLHAEFGGYFSNGEYGLLGSLSLRHQAGPYTQQTLFIGRSLNSFYDQIDEGIGYNIRQILGPKIALDAFILATNIYYLNGVGSSYREYRTGLRFSIVAGPRTNFILTGTYSLLEYESGQSNTWTGLAEVSHYFTDTLRARLVYQYQQNDSDFFNDNYYENLVFFSLEKYFN